MVTKKLESKDIKKVTLLLPKDYISMLDELVIDYKTGSRGRCVEVMIDKLTSRGNGN